jgi:membrane-associated phospholipid phosphatase
MNRKKSIIISFVLSIFLSGNTQNWDIDLAKTINPTYPTSGYWKFTSASTYWISAGIPFSLLVAGFIENNAELKRNSYTKLGGIANELIVSETLKTTIDRKRPAEKYPADICPSKNIHGRSFPSGHISLAFAATAGFSI